MSLLFAISVSDPERIRCALHPYRDALRVPAEDARDGWGLGFYQGDEMLLRSRPLAGQAHLDFYELARELRSDVMVGHVAGPSTANRAMTAPFRFRQWMGAHSGAIQNFSDIRTELLGTIPEFLRRNLRGQSDSEHLFHLVLAFLHDSGKLDDSRSTPSVLVEAIRAALTFVQRALSTQGDAEAVRTSTMNFVITNGDVIAAVRRGLPMVVLRRNGVGECPVCRAANTAQGRGARQTSHEQLRSVLLLSRPDIPGELGGEEVPDGSIVVVDHSLNVSLQSALS